MDGILSGAGTSLTRTQARVGASLTFVTAAAYTNFLSYSFNRVDDAGRCSNATRGTGVRPGATLVDDWVRDCDE